MQAVPQQRQVIQAAPRVCNCPNSLPRCAAARLESAFSSWETTHGTRVQESLSESNHRLDPFGPPHSRCSLLKVLEKSRRNSPVAMSTFVPAPFKQRIDLPQPGLIQQNPVSHTNGAIFAAAAHIPLICRPSTVRNETAGAAIISSVSAFRCASQIASDRSKSHPQPARPIYPRKPDQCPRGCPIFTRPGAFSAANIIMRWRQNHLGALETKRFRPTLHARLANRPLPSEAMGQEPPRLPITLRHRRPSTPHAPVAGTTFCALMMTMWPALCRQHSGNHGRSSPIKRHNLPFASSPHGRPHYRILPVHCPTRHRIRQTTTRRA